MKFPISAAAVESTEFEALLNFVCAPNAQERQRHGISTLRLGGGGAMSVLGDTTSFWSKALGFGFSEAVTMNLIEQIIDFYRAQGAKRARIQVAPPVLPADWPQIRARMGLSRGDVSVKLACEAQAALAKPSPRLADGLRVGLIDQAQAGEWAATMMKVFEMPDECDTAMAAATVGRAGWSAHAVWAGDKMIATAVMYVRGDTCQLFGGSTLLGWRRQGAQSALIAARAQAAAGAGCRWLVTETSAESRGRHNTSLRNLRAMGFELLYERPSWIWNSTGEASE